MRAVALLLLVAGCDGLFHLAEVKGEDAGPDTPPDAAFTCFVESFSGTNSDLAGRWTLSGDPGCHSDVMNDTLVLQADSGTDCFAWAFTRDLSSFVDNVATVEVPQVIGVGQQETLFQLIVDNDNYYIIQYYDGRLSAFQRYLGSTQMANHDVAYDAVAQRFWRFQYNAAGPNGPSIDCLTSPNAIDFTMLDSIDVRVPLDNIGIQLISGTFTTPPASAQTSVYDNFSRCAPP